MNPSFDIAVIVGSNRRESINRKLAQALVRLAPETLACRFVQIDDLPIYNGDLEENRPDSVRRFTSEVAAVGASDRTGRRTTSRPDSISTTTTPRCSARRRARRGTRSDSRSSTRTCGNG